MAEDPKPEADKEQSRDPSLADIETSETNHHASSDGVTEALTGNKDIFHLKVYSPYKVYFDDDVYSVSAENATGPFDILPQHKNFMTLLSPCDIKIRYARGDDTVTISRGIMHVKADKVIVFLDV